MPREGKRRKKRRTHVDQSKLTSKVSTPQCIIARQGKVGQTVSLLVEDLREMMMPNTASKLKERRSTSVKEYIRFGVPMGATHLMLFNQTETAVNTRVACLPRGPTVTFRVREFSIATEAVFRTAPLVLLNNFDDSKPELRLASVTLQNMFPSLAVATVKLADCQRCVLFSYEAETGLIHMRHYAIQTKASAASRSIRRVVKDRVPSLHHLDDISEFILGKGAAADGGATSESEAEEEAVTLPRQMRSKRGPRVQRAALKLVEIGPRAAMEVVKVQRGVCEGDVLYHKFEKKTPQEAAELRRKVQERERLRVQRRAEQEENVRRKKEEQERSAEEKRRCLEAKRAAALEAAGHTEGDAATSSAMVQLDDIVGGSDGEEGEEEEEGEEGGSEASEPEFDEEEEEDDVEDDDEEEDDEDDEEGSEGEGAAAQAGAGSAPSGPTLRKRPRRGRSAMS